MPTTQADIDALLSALKSGERLVRFADGSTVEYRTVADIREALGVLRAEGATVLNRTTPTYSVRG
jgi:hypothetical protein